MKKKAIVIFLGVFMACWSFQPVLAQKEKFHSIFIYNFSKYVKWPDNLGSGKFVIGVIGNSPILSELKDLSISKQVNNMAIEIRQLTSVSDLSQCHILYVTSSESGKLDQVVAKTQGQPVLIVADRPGMASKGATISFVEVEGKVKFELSQQNAESRGLKVSTSLASLAINV